MPTILHHLNRSIKFSLLVAFAVMLQEFSGFAQPGNYYDPATGLQGAALKSALHNIIDEHTTISYDAVTDALKVLEQDPNNSSNVILLYKQTSTPKTNFGGGADNWNREHIWPQSHGDFGTSEPTGTDLHHMRATDVSVNADRGEKDFDNGGTTHPEATLCKYTTNSWEPPDAVKGDIARMVFYMAVRYEGDAGEVNLEIQNNYTGTSTSPGYLGKLSTLMAWHYADPVDSREQTRNNTIYYNYQNNRNPFIDHPEYANLIWPGYAPYADEPSNHAADFSAHCITLNWLDATGTVVPTGYLVRMSSVGFGDIAVPADHSPVTNDFFNKNVAYGVKKAIFGGLTTNTLYYFKIYPYTGSGTNIDYKTDGEIQQVSIQAK